MKLKERSWKLKEKASNETKKYLAYISLAIHKPINRRCFTCESAHCYKVYCRIPCNSSSQPHIHTNIRWRGRSRARWKARISANLYKTNEDSLRGESQIHATYYWLIIIYLFINELTWFIRSYMWARGKNDKCTSSGVSSGNPLWNWCEMKTYD